MTDLNVIIATAERPTLLRRTLASLARCRRPSGYRRTFVVENGGQRGADEVVAAADPSLRCAYLYEPHGNKSMALNRAMEDLDQGLIFFTDDDVRLHPETLVSYAVAAEGTDRGRYYGGPTGVDYEQTPPAWVQRRLPLSARGWVPTEQQRNSASLSFLGFNWAAFATEIRALGGFDPLRGPGAVTGSTGQEGEMQMRLRDAGVTPTYVPQAWVWHYVPRDRCSPDWAVQRAFRHGVSWGMQSHAGPLTIWSCPPWVVARLAKSAVRRLLATVAGPEFGFDARVRASYNHGLVHGFRMRRLAPVAPVTIKQRSVS